MTTRQNRQQKSRTKNLIRGMSNGRLLIILRNHELRLDALDGVVAELTEKVKNQGHALVWCLGELKHPAFTPEAMEEARLALEAAQQAAAPPALPPATLDVPHGMGAVEDEVPPVDTLDV